MATARWPRGFEPRLSSQRRHNGVCPIHLGDDMRGFGLVIAMDAIDRALQEQVEAARRRPPRPASTVDADGEPVDRLSDAAAATRMSAWRAWATRPQAPVPKPSLALVPRRSDADGATTSG